MFERYILCSRREKDFLRSTGCVNGGGEGTSLLTKKAQTHIVKCNTQLRSDLFTALSTLLIENYREVDDV